MDAIIISAQYSEREYTAYIRSDYGEGCYITLTKSDDSDNIHISLGGTPICESSASSGSLRIPSEIAKWLGEQLLVAGQSCIDKYSSSIKVSNNKIKKFKVRK